MIALLALLQLAAEPLPYACGPYLLLPGTEQMTVVVDHHQAVRAELVYGLANSDVESRVPHLQAQRHHVFSLTGLQPGAEYWYEVRTGDELASGRCSFRTLPKRPDRYEVVVLGDVRSLPQRWHAVSQRVFTQEKDALFVIGTGDYPSDGSKYGLWRKQFFEPARSLLAHKPMWPAIGNHEMTRRHDDLTRPEASKFFSLFELPGNERWYRVDYHLLTLLVIDSNSRLSPGHEQYEWLRQQLRSERKRYTLVAFHHAPFTSGPHGALHPDGTPKEWPLDEGRRFLVPLFEMYGVDVVLNGHDHLYERSLKNGIPYVVTGGGGAPLYKVNSSPNPYQVVAKSTNHYMRLGIDERGIDLEAVDVQGKVFDAFRVEPNPENLQRRAHFVGKRIDAAVRTGAPDLAARTLPFEVHNPLDHDIHVSLTLREGQAAEGAGFPFEARKVRPGEAWKHFLPLEPEPAGSSWSIYRTANLQWSVKGQAESLPIDHQANRRVVLKVPEYELGQIEGVSIDGAAEEWAAVPSMAIGPEQPVARGRQHYAGADDCRADLRMARSDGFLHVFFAVHDPQIVDSGKGSYFVNDSCNLVFQAPRGTPQAKAPTILAFGASGRANCEVEHRVLATKQGYVVEASIPIAMIPFAKGASPGLEVQFEVVLVDQDPGQGPSLHRLWTDHLRANVADYGVLRSR